MAALKVKYSELRPSEFRKRLLQKPLAYLPLGTLEWHGEHLPFGTDAIESEALMVACAEKHGGIVLPALFLGPDRRMDQEDGSYLIGMDYAKTTSPNQQLEGSCYWVDYPFFEQMVKKILEQLKRAGFKAVFADGHGPSRRSWTAMSPIWEKELGMRLLGITAELKEEFPYMSDHAARNETSITMHVQPNLVDLSVFKEKELSPLVGVNGEHPFLATAEYGKAVFEKSLATLGAMIDPI